MGGAGDGAGGSGDAVLKCRGTRTCLIRCMTTLERRKQMLGDDETRATAFLDRLTGR